MSTELRGAAATYQQIASREEGKMSSVRIERARQNVFNVTATGQELSALVAAARMALEAMRSSPEPPPTEAIELLDRVLRDFDSARQRLASDPSAGS